MKTSARISAMADQTVIQLSKRIMKKRGFFGAIAPDRTGRGWLHRLGLDKFDASVGPELTIAACCKEGASLGILSNSKQMNDRFSVIEYRVFGMSCGDGYPMFNTFEDWLMWRIPIAHPDYGCESDLNGWTLELYRFAVEDAKNSF